MESSNVTIAIVLGISVDCYKKKYIYIYYKMLVGILYKKGTLLLSDLPSMLNHFNL